MKTVYFEGKTVEPCFGQSKKLEKMFWSGIEKSEDIFLIESGKI